MKTSNLLLISAERKPSHGWARWLCFLALVANPFLPWNKASFGNNSQVNPEVDSLKAILSKPLNSGDKIKTLSALGKAFFSESELDSALNRENQALKLICKGGTKLDSAKCFMILGLIYTQKSWYDKALENLQRSQQLYGESGDTSLQAKAFMNIGVVHDYLENLPMALLYYEKALKFLELKNDQAGIAACKLNIAIGLTKQEKYEQACTYLKSAADVYTKMGYTSNLAAAYINLGLTYKKMGNYALAIDYNNKAFDIWEKADDQYHMCYYYMNMGEIMLDMKKTDEAGKYLRQAEKLVITFGSKDLQATTYEYLSDYHAAKKNFAEAYAYLSKSKQINDSILNAETTEKISQIQYRYEIARRETDNVNLVKQNLGNELQLQKKNMFLHILIGVLLTILLLVILLMRQNRVKHKINGELEAKNKLIEEQKEELIKLNASKDKFLSILAHDIKNPLSSIHGLSDVLVTDYDQLTAQEKMVFTKDIHTLSNNLFEMINTLLAWSTSQSGMLAYRPKPFLISDLCRQSVRNLQTVAKQKDILLVCKTDDKFSVMADENMILSVLHNLLNNAIKYSYPGTNIRVEAKLDDGIAHISVIDSGIGLSPESMAKLFRYDQHFLNKGTAGEMGTGLGLILCKDFVEKNGGTITVDSTIGKGSTFTFTLPLA